VETSQPDAREIEHRWNELANWTPKQKQALDAMYKELFVLYGGARGGGKSRWLRWALLDFLITCHFLKIPNVRVMLACETYPDLQDRQLSKIRTEFPTWLGEMRRTDVDGHAFYLTKDLSGGILTLRNLDRVEKYQSAEFAAIGVDELTKDTKATFDILRGSLRWPGIVHTPFIGATNPGGIGHRWVKDLWVDHNFTDYPELLPFAKQFKFIQSLPADNPHLTPEYWEMLNTLPTGLRKAWVLGDWDVFQGQAIPGFSKELHVLKKQIDLPNFWPRWRAVDWGFAAPFCCQWFCKDPDTQRVFVYREVYQAGLTSKQQADLILANTPTAEKINITYADPSMWTRKEMEGQVTTTADEYYRYGVPLTKGDNDRIGGKRKVDGILSNLPDGFAGLLIFPNCANLIKTLGNLAYDEHNVEDVDTNQEDHSYDTLRMGLTNVKGIYAPKKREEPDRSPLELARGMF